MIICTRSLFIFLFFLFNQSVHAQLLPEKSVTPVVAEDYVRSIPHRELGEYVEKHGATITNKETKSIDKPDIYFPFSRSVFAWNFRKNETFYTAIYPLRTDLIPPRNCTVDPSDEKFLDQYECESAIRKFTQCQLLIYGV